MTLLGGTLNPYSQLYYELKGKRIELFQQNTNPCWPTKYFADIFLFVFLQKFQNVLFHIKTRWKKYSKEKLEVSIMTYS